MSFFPFHDEHKKSETSSLEESPIHVFKCDKKRKVRVSIISN